MTTLADNFTYFTDNHDALFNAYPNKHLVIKDKTVLYDADTFEEALQKAEAAGLEIGTYLIQYCSEGDNAYTQTFHSRVIF